MKKDNSASRCHGAIYLAIVAWLAGSLAIGSAVGTMRTASSSRPHMRRKPICGAKPSLSAGRRRSSISRRSASVK
jgi:hypothetical protein